MSPQGFDLKVMAVEIEKAINKDIPIVIAKRAVDFFKNNFQQEGFQDGSLKKWKEVKRRSAESLKRGKRGNVLKRQPADQTRKILTGRTGNLGRSIQWELKGNGKVLIFSDAEYAEAHNEGTTTAGRGNSTTIEQRQFVGDSVDVERIVTEEVERKFEQIFGK